MHVLIIPAWMPSVHDPASGLFILDQAIALKAEGKIQVGILFMDTHPATQDTLDLLKAHDIPHVIAQRMYVPKAAGLLIRLWCAQYFKVYREYCARFGTPQILHAHSYVAGFAASHISAKAGIPFVLTEHATNFLTDRIRPTQRSSVKQVLERASRIIAVGTALRAAISEWTSKLAVQLPNPIDQNLFFYDPEATKPSTFTVIAIGSLIPRKRIDVLLKAITLCTDVKLMIIGSGIEEEKLKQLARSLGVSPQTAWTRFMPSAELAKVLRSGHLLVSASDTETFGIVVAEAMMCGLPVICTASGGPEELVGEKHGIVLEKLATPQELATAIQHIQTNYAQYNAVDIAVSAKEQFSRQVVIPKILGHYQEILNQSV